jgi:hypothetical protein
VEHSEDEGIMKAWELDMADFYPEIMLSVDLLAKSDEVFCHDVKEGQQPTMRGAYFTGGENADDHPEIDFFILDEMRRVVFSRRKKGEGLFAYNATKPG